MVLVVKRRPAVRYLLYGQKKHQFDIVISEEWQVQEWKNRSTEGNYTGTWHMQHFVSKFHLRGNQFTYTCDFTLTVLSYITQPKDSTKVIL